MNLILVLHDEGFSSCSYDGLPVVNPRVQLKDITVTLQHMNKGNEVAPLKTMFVEVCINHKIEECLSLSLCL